MFVSVLCFFGCFPVDGFLNPTALRSHILFCEGWRGSAGSWNLFSEASKCQFEWIWLSGWVNGGFVCGPFLDT